MPQDLADRDPTFLRRLMDGHVDEGELTFVRRVLAPTVAAVSATAIGVAAAKACCGKDPTKLDPHGIVPIGMAVLTSGIALYSYFNPQPSNLAKKVRGK